MECDIASTIAMDEVAVGRAPKRPHRKSKMGCQTCKKRKIKCDELKPACRNCVRHLVVCDFLKINPVAPARGMGIALHSSAEDADGGAASPLPTPTATPSTPPVDRELNFVDLELMHNFTTSVYLTLSTDPLVRQMWRVSVVGLALRCDYVMRTLLSISALHLAHQQPGRKEALVAKALSYHRIASRQAMGLMSGLDEENAENLFLFSLLTIFFALASGRYLKESVVVWESAFPDWTFLLSGTCSLIKLLTSRSYDGVLSPIITYATERFHAARRDPHTHPEALETLRELIGNECDDGDLSRIYGSAIDELRYPLSLATREGAGGMDIMDMFIWKYFVFEEFLPLLKTPAEYQHAVVIYAHFCIVLSKLESQWWLQGWATHLMSQAWALLDEEHKAWVKWPMHELGWTPPG